jgi:HPt (histidine-containing phosphotransfer) domain-containing protein
LGKATFSIVFRYLVIFLSPHMIKQLDRQFLTSYYHDMVDEIGEIFELFLQETPADIADIKNLIATNKFKEAGDQLHKIIPSFSNVGLPQLSRQLREVETAVQANDGAKATALMKAFEKELEGYMPAILEENKRLNNK